MNIVISFSSVIDWTILSGATRTTFNVACNYHIQYIGAYSIRWWRAVGILFFEAVTVDAGNIRAHVTPV
jgi:hypothetical protein